MSGLLTKNPCVDVCDFTKKKICKACGRTKAEEKGWKKLTPQEKHAVWMRILETHAKPDSKKGRKLIARHEHAKARARPVPDGDTA